VKGQVLVIASPHVCNTGFYIIWHSKLFLKMKDSSIIAGEYCASISIHLKSRNLKNLYLVSSIEGYRLHKISNQNLEVLGGSPPAPSCLCDS
jgi:hypothetical protein